MCCSHVVGHETAGARPVALALTQQPRHGHNHRQACPVHASFDGILDPRCLLAQEDQRPPRIPWLAL